MKTKYLHGSMVFTNYDYDMFWKWISCFSLLYRSI